MNKRLGIGSLVHFSESNIPTPWVGIVISVVGDQIAVHWSTGHMWLHDIESIVMV